MATVFNKIFVYIYIYTCISKYIYYIYKIHFAYKKLTDFQQLTLDHVYLI